MGSSKLTLRQLHPGGSVSGEKKGGAEKGGTTGGAPAVTGVNPIKGYGIALISCILDEARLVAFQRSRSFCMDCMERGNNKEIVTKVPVSKNVAKRSSMSDIPFVDFKLQEKVFKGIAVEIFHPSAA